MNSTSIKNNILKLCSTSSPRIVLGLSGGPDSIFLFHILAALHQEKKITLIAAHLDHGWRATSQHDADFCKQLAQNYDIEISVKHAREFSAITNTEGSTESFGRKLRRAFFEEVRIHYKADVIALAHHLNDQQETFLFRLMRGTSLSGLCGMRARNGHYIRPLLSIGKKEIVNYLQEHNLPYCNDESNTSHKYLRNRIRLTVIPALEACDERFSKKFLDTVTWLQQENEYIEHRSTEAFNTIFTFLTERNHYEGDAEVFKNQHSVIQRRVILLWLIKEKVVFTPSNAHLREIIHFLISPRGGVHQLHPSWNIEKKSSSFRINTRIVHDS